MKQEDLNLLFIELSARLPYGVMVAEFDEHGRKISMTAPLTNMCNVESHYRDLKLYLFPLSSMTEEQKKECFRGTSLEIDKYGDVAVKDDFYGGSKYTDLEMYLEVIAWLNENHFDYRGLIHKGLAIDATNLNIYN